MPSSVRSKQSAGQTAIHGASVQCIQATEIELSPGSPSFKVTTRRRWIPHCSASSFSFLHAVTQPLHSIQRFESHKNFILAIRMTPYALDILQRVTLVSCICVTGS